MDKMHKYHLFLTLTAEETWLNTIQAQGYRLIRVNRFLHRYTFEPLARDAQFCPVTRLDFRQMKWWGGDYPVYRTLMADSGWQLLAGSRYGGVQYLQQNRPMATPRLFSDQFSRATVLRHDLGYSAAWGVVFLLYTWNWCTNFATDGWWSLIDIKSWYLTQGLWTMHGRLFWLALTFETPFVLLRTVPLYLFLGMGIYFLLRSLVTLRVTTQKED